MSLRSTAVVFRACDITLELIWYSSTVHIQWISSMVYLINLRTFKNNWYVTWQLCLSLFRIRSCSAQHKRLNCFTRTPIGSLPWTLSSRSAVGWQSGSQSNVLAFLQLQAKENWIIWGENPINKGYSQPLRSFFSNTFTTTLQQQWIPSCYCSSGGALKARLGRNMSQRC